MNRCFLIGCVAAGLLALTTSVRAADPPKTEDHHAHHFDACAKACADCMRECESCAHHCAHQVAEGHKDHATTLGTCADCAEFCTAAAKIVSHHGPMAGTICEACAKACDTCGAACAKFPDDEHMARCAQACRDCAKACREMLEHTQQDLPK